MKLGRDLDLSDAAGGVHGAPVGVDEGDAGWTPFQMDLQRPGGISGKLAFQIIGEEVSDFPAPQH